MNTNIHLTVLAVALLSAFRSRSPLTAAYRSTAAQKNRLRVDAKDKLSLTSKQQTTAWQDIRKQATKRESACALRSKSVSGSERIDDLSRSDDRSSKVPVLRRYQYALLQNNRF